MNADVLAAFDGLLDALNSEKAHLSDSVRQATLNGQFDDAKRILSRAERVVSLVDGLQRMREAWEALGEPEPPAVREREPEAAESGVRTGEDEDAPELEVAERLFSSPRHQRRRTRQRVDKTPEHAYRAPILEALEQLGGSGRVRDVLNIVYAKMKDRLTEDDLRNLPSGRAVRWANTARWARQDMVDEGLLRDDSPTGVWQATEAGGEYLQRARQQGEGTDDP